MLTYWIFLLFTFLFCSSGNPKASLYFAHSCVQRVQYHKTRCVDKQQGFADEVVVIFSLSAALDFFQFVGMSILSV